MTPLPIFYLRVAYWHENVDHQKTFDAFYTFIDHARKHEKCVSWSFAQCRRMLKQIEPIHFSFRLYLRCHISSGQCNISYFSGQGLFRLGVKSQSIRSWEICSKTRLMNTMNNPKFVDHRWKMLRQCVYSSSLVASSHVVRWIREVKRKWPRAKFKCTLLSLNNVLHF